VSLISAEKATPLFDRIQSLVKLDPKNATWSTDGNTASVIPSVAGRQLDREKTAEVLTGITRSTSNRRGEVAVTEVKPDRTTEAAEAMGIKTALASFTTEFGGSENRRDNVQLAAQIIHNTLVAPGEQFSFNDVVGRRTSERGFKTAPVIIEGGRLEDDLGGGICQVSTTLFNAAFFAGLDITERWNHSRYISSYPAGRDATVSWPAPNLRFRNDTPGWILVRASASRSSVTFVIYGTSQGRKVTYTTSEFYNIRLAKEKREQTGAIFVGETRVKDGGQDGKDIKVVRTVTQNGEVIHKDVFVSTYPMFPRVVEEGTKTTTTTLAPATTTTKPPSPTTTTTTKPPSPTTTTTTTTPES
jgi:vancomycin resistance protein YoaR